MKTYSETLYKDYRQVFDVTDVLYEDKTDHQHLVIFENPRFGRVLALDGVIQVTERDEFIYHEMLAHVPIVAHGKAKNVLIIGGGDGGTLREALRHPSVESAVMVEIDRTVVDLCTEHMPGVSAGAFDDARTELIIADGLKYVAETDRRFDVIMVDSTDPIGPGEVLFTETFYADCKRSLTDGGVLVTQNGVPFFQGDEVRNSHARLKPSFEDVGFYVAPVPTYIGGFMTLGWATDDASLRTLDADALGQRFNASGIETRYYTPAVHAGAFALPGYINRLF